MVDKFQVQQAEQIAWELGQRHPTEQFAWVTMKEQILYLRRPRVFCETWQGVTSPLNLFIQTLFDKKLDHSFFILRKRLWTTLPLTEFDKGMVRIAAKRATGLVESVNHGIGISQQWIALDSGEGFFESTLLSFPVLWQWQEMVTTDQQAALALESILEKVPRGNVLHDFERAIAAMLVNQQGQVVSWSVNSNSKNKTLHAEVNLVQGLLRNFKDSTELLDLKKQQLKLYVSLKPCVMCAALLKEFFGPLLEVIYFEKDGAGSDKTILDQSGQIRPSQKNLALHWNLR